MRKLCEKWQKFRQFCSPHKEQASKVLAKKYIDAFDVEQQFTQQEKDIT